jgi:hypothetical protein
MNDDKKETGTLKEIKRVGKKNKWMNILVASAVILSADVFGVHFRCVS